MMRLTAGQTLAATYTPQWDARKLQASEGSLLCINTGGGRIGIHCMPKKLCLNMVARYVRLCQQDWRKAGLLPQKRFFQIGLHRFRAEPDFQQRFVEIIARNRTLGLTVELYARAGTGNIVEHDNIAR